LVAKYRETGCFSFGKLEFFQRIANPPVAVIAGNYPALLMASSKALYLFFK
jgi:hypothetical protein